jgi:hypothetical protein
MPPALQQTHPDLVHGCVAHETKPPPLGHCVSSTQVAIERQQTVVPSACEQLPVFAHADPIG